MRVLRVIFCRGNPQTWRLLSAETHRLRMIAKRVIHRCMRAELLPALARWQEMAMESRRLRAIARRVAVRCMRAALVPAFWRWLEIAWDSKRKRLLASKAVSRWANRELFCSFQQWSDWIRSREACVGSLGDDDLVHAWEGFIRSKPCSALVPLPLLPMQWSCLTRHQPCRQIAIALEGFYPRARMGDCSALGLRAFTWPAISDVPT